MPDTSTLKKRAQLVARRLRKAYPDAHCELNFSTPLELAVASILSAQCTDRRVNQLTPRLFSRFDTAEDLAAIPVNELEELIRPAGFYRNKAKSIHGLSLALHEKHGGKLPDTMDTLVKLPGIGRKTANVLLISAFEKPGITVDTHCKRVSTRLGLTRQKNPDHIEAELKSLLPRNRWAAFSHGIVWHGRYCCHARKPACSECSLNDICPAADPSVST
jgi:endonuclease-3